MSADKVTIDLTGDSPVGSATPDQCTKRTRSPTHEEAAGSSLDGSFQPNDKKPKPAAPPASVALGASRPVLREVALALADFAPLLCENDLSVPRQEESWTCGYANLQALLETLARVRSDAPVACEVTALQRQVEAAWREGFDPISAAQYRGVLAGKRGTAGWIGAPEMYACLTHMREDALIFEIIGRSGAGAAIHQIVTSLMRGDGNDTPGPRTPIVLQHDGHSRLIVGTLPGGTCAEEGGAARRLLICDPQQRGSARVECVRCTKLDGRQYQLVAVSGRRLDEAEALGRRGDPQPAAMWDEGGRWGYSDFWRPRYRRG